MSKLETEETFFIKPFIQHFPVTWPQWAHAATPPPRCRKHGATMGVGEGFPIGSPSDSPSDHVLVVFLGGPHFSESPERRLLEPVLLQVKPLLRHIVDLFLRPLHHGAQRSYGREKNTSSFGIANLTNYIQLLSFSMFLRRLYHLYLYRRKVFPLTRWNIHWSHRDTPASSPAKISGNSWTFGVCQPIEIIGTQSEIEKMFCPCNFWMVFAIWSLKQKEVPLRFVAIDVTRLSALSTHQNHDRRSRDFGLGPHRCRWTVMNHDTFQQQKGCHDHFKRNNIDKEW